MINFIYEVDNDKHIIWTYENNKIKNKRYFYQNLSHIDFKPPIKYFIKDTKFNFYYKKLAIFTSKPFSIKVLEKEIGKFQKKDEEIVWYLINNVKVNQKKEKFILWKTGEIEFWLWVYALHKKYKDKINKIFWKKPINIFPTSIGTIYCLNKLFCNGNMLYLSSTKTKIITLKNWFYKNIEEINIWTNQLNNWILETFHENINIFQLNDFQQKVYKKILNKFLQPILIFIKNNLIGNNLYIIWDISNYPFLIETISNGIKLPVIPLRIDGKTFKNIEKVDLFCLEKINV